MSATQGTGVQGVAVTEYDGEAVLIECLKCDTTFLGKRQYQRHPCVAGVCDECGDELVEDERSTCGPCVQLDPVPGGGCDV